DGSVSPGREPSPGGSARPCRTSSGDSRVSGPRADTITRVWPARCGGRALRLRGEALARLDAADFDAVEAEYVRALALAEECGMRPLIARYHNGLSALYERRSKRQAAAKHLA